MNVGNFLQLESAFQSNWEVVLAPEEEEVLRLLILCGDLANEVIAFEDLFNLPGNGFQRLNNLLAPVERQHPHPPHEQSEQGQRSNLRGKRLCGSNANFRPGMQINPPVGFTGDGASDNIAKGQDL